MSTNVTSCTNMKPLGWKWKIYLWLLLPCGVAWYLTRTLAYVNNQNPIFSQCRLIHPSRLVVASSVWRQIHSYRLVLGKGWSWSAQPLDVDPRTALPLQACRWLCMTPRNRTCLEYLLFQSKLASMHKEYIDLALQPNSIKLLSAKAAIWRGSFQL